MARDSALLKTVRGLRREKIYPINEMNGRSVDVGIPFDEANEKRSRLIGNNKENYAFFNILIKFQVSDFDFNDIFSAYFFLVNYQLSCVRNIFVRNDRNLSKKKKRNFTTFNTICFNEYVMEECVDEECHASINRIIND